MAWTTSACLRARPAAWDNLAAWRKTARFLAIALRRSLWRRHPSFALALPVAGLGLLATLLPASAIAALLLGAAAILALIALTTTHEPRRTRPRAARTNHFAELTPRPATATAFPIAEYARAQRRAVVQTPTRHPRIVTEQKDRNWAELMSRVNHDLRTPLNAVMGFSELMVLELFGPLGDERYQDYVHHIRDSATDLLKSAEDTLALTALIASHSPREDMGACTLASIAKEAWTFLDRKAATRAIGFDPRIPAELEVLGEPRVLRQVLINMLSEGIARAMHGERVVLAVTIEGELIELSLSVTKERSRTQHSDSSLATCLARTLLEMQGSSLLELNSPSHGWCLVTVLDRVVQTDFFPEFPEPRMRAPAERIAHQGLAPVV